MTPEHGWITRSFWPAVLGTDGVRPSVEHLPALRRMFTEVHCTVQSGGFPYVPMLKAPFYYFIGRKTQ